MVNIGNLRSTSHRVLCLNSQHLFYYIKSAISNNNIKTLVMDYALDWLVAPIVGFCSYSMFCRALLCVHSSFAIILMGQRELVALLSLSPWCLVIVVLLLLVVSWVCLQFVIVVFPDHTHLLFMTFFFNLMQILSTYGQERVHTRLFHSYMTLLTLKKRLI